MNGMLDSRDDAIDRNTICCCPMLGGVFVCFTNRPTDASAFPVGGVRDPDTRLLRRSIIKEVQFIRFWSVE